MQQAGRKVHLSPVAAHLLAYPRKRKTLLQPSALTGNFYNKNCIS